MDVDAFPKGASPFGVMDMVGNVWQCTDEFIDEYTRAAILRGSAYYQPAGSLWYFPTAYKLSEHGKYLFSLQAKTARVQWVSAVLSTRNEFGHTLGKASTMRG